MTVDLHAGNKKTIASRLAVAGANVAYNINKFPTNGPFPISFGPDPKDKDRKIVIHYDKSKTVRS